MLFGCVVLLYVRIIQHLTVTKRQVQLKSMTKVLTMLVCPTECQHNLMEKFFKNPTNPCIFEPCCLKCSKCTHSLNQQIGRVHWNCLTHLLISFCTSTMQPFATLIKIVKTKRSEIFHKNDVANKLMGRIHALCLQLVAMEIIQLQIMEDKKHLISKLELLPKFVIVKLGILDGQPLVLIDSYWEKI